MLFSSLVFLWYFLPIVFVLYYIIPTITLKNLLLLIASLFFYAWGEPVYIILMVISIFLNYIFGLAVSQANAKKFYVFLAVVVNIGLLGYFKYFNFFVNTINEIAGSEIFATRNIALPIGISFYTFQALSYVIDVYRGDTKAQNNIYKLALYISFFPQLIAGPIVKYHDIDEQLNSRRINTGKLAYGVKRFTFGLAKKVMLANTFAQVVDNVMAPNVRANANISLMWFVCILYSLQIYYDFSGYSDMAIGLGKMFGFDFNENFNYPYISRSIQEFWRRWHISLSTWFKEYLYIPLGGNRKGIFRTYINLFIVFFTTGFWHGASKNFIVWGLWHGFFMIIERIFLGKLLEKNPFKVINHIYSLFVVVVGFMIFRIESINQIIDSLKIMFGNKNGYYSIPMYVDRRVWFFFIVGIILCGPFQCIFKKFKENLFDEEDVKVYEIITAAFLLAFSIILLVNNTYNPFIYFRF